MNTMSDQCGPYVQYNCDIHRELRSNDISDHTVYGNQFDLDNCKLIEQRLVYMCMLQKRQVYHMVSINDTIATCMIVHMH